MRRAIVGAAVLVLLAGAGAVAWLLLRTEAVTPAGELVAGVPAQVVTTVPAEEDLAEAMALLTDLPSSGLTALTPEARSLVESSGTRTVLAVDSRVTVDPATWADIGAAATVEVTVDGTDRYVASLVRVAEGWRLVALTPETS
ncbi:hypothetical protein [Pseudonocardia oroxyli]|uniref:Uncharacterized protein n=1 Tax=Pseudonocardia oroxyli TaxID=366584 RepID=A0A1G8BCU7_PSEOR|nr:hypothetical protein [Pseudonocardia oroxyli]SDH31046.1 hypothetical protein SAMN05216377_1215 [Pseudonocardia oroxyli]